MHDKSCALDRSFADARSAHPATPRRTRTDTRSWRRLHHRERKGARRRSPTRQHRMRTRRGHTSSGLWHTTGRGRLRRTAIRYEGPIPAARSRSDRAAHTWLRLRRRRRCSRCSLCRRSDGDAHPVSRSTHFRRPRPRSLPGNRARTRVRRFRAVPTENRPPTPPERQRARRGRSRRYISRFRSPRRGSVDAARRVSCGFELREVRGAVVTRGYTEPSERTITVIIPTVALVERTDHLHRAIDSVLQQEDVNALPLVVVNGTAADRELVHELSRRTDIEFASLATANLPAALRAGRALVRSPWFAELDDDDVLLPNALATRIRVLASDPTISAVVSNGIIRGGPEGDLPAITDTARTAAYSLSALDAATWCTPRVEHCSARRPCHGSCSTACRNISNGPISRYASRNLASSPSFSEPTFVRHTDSPFSVWASDGCRLGLPAAIEKVLTLDLPPSLRRVFETRLTAACHEAAVLHLRHGRVGSAITWHLRSLNTVRGWRYLPFTRKLLLGLGAKRAASRPRPSARIRRRQSGTLATLGSGRQAAEPRAPHRRRRLGHEPRARALLRRLHLAIAVYGHVARSARSS